MVRRASPNVSLSDAKGTARNNRTNNGPASTMTAARVSGKT